MEVTSSELLCKCCLNENGLRDMWAGYISSDTGEFEIFGQMLTDCFTLPWAPPEEETTQELICNSCVDRLRIAYNFKKEILETNELLIEVDNKSKIKAEEATESKFKVTFSDEEDEAPTAEPEYYEEEWLVENLKQEPETEQYEEVEYLEEDVPNAIDCSVDSEDQETDYEPSKKKKKNRSYKNYTEVELKAALAAIQDKKMTYHTAAKLYNIPRNTLRFKMGMDEKDVPTAKSHLKFVREIQTILKYTNATPFKSRTAKLLCAYCPTQSQIYDDPDILRDHTNTKHGSERIRSLEFIMRPVWCFETLRIDIYNLQCTVCCTTLQSWQDMYSHLEIKHKATMELTHNKLIPYILTDTQYICALCDKKYDSYYHLDIHMNNHFQNHLCLECGDPFLTETRLKKHLKKHQVGQFPCEICGMVFTLENYRKKHFDNRHKQVSKIKCQYCNERFHGEYQRHLHVLENHNEKVRTYTCPLCEREYNWHPYYLKHLQRHHSNKKTKEYECKICVQKFESLSDRRQHKLEVHKKLSKPNSNIKLLRKANDELVRKSRSTGKHFTEENMDRKLFQ